ncbi:quinone-dependent dihydroorotate dehydrogenase [Rhizobium sp. SSA_523]|uniref:quinone-dependent dihydroorotate dehydrogenase n=1 Tax=Rhizobium sp. SSA_523 TaxID=2952477 RepID=UPI00209052D4|nr:quinone-dependent dihydroorotate dehydrogenase [Rhizobium sp. SSA_523]MCO5732928.1 quinone-dependent dihydroorotate dehydrogenase [Rhizobium sp. SSA_523]WKC23816.1 quinone-dependent dihydroorotate dehydrogenase [Rhizobium sp. SSA_523]
MPIYDFARRALFLLDPEAAHGASVAGLKTGLVPPCSMRADPRLAVRLAGLDFPNPIGLAAGYDKNAEVPQAILRLGFGFTEVGTLTPRAQAGNPKPRMFRLVADRGVINRLGFNNEGHDAAFARLSALKAGGGLHSSGLLGVNIGANKDAEDRIADYVSGIHRFYDLAHYFTVNISSPNTPGLRDLQARESLSALLKAVLAAREEHHERSGRLVPVFLKIAPDLTEEGMDDIAEEVLAHALDGLIISNTTLSREGLKDKGQAQEAGGLSGAPLFRRSTAVLARMRKRLGPHMPIIGVGGVSSAETALDKIRAGADLVQLYSGMVYHGPTIAADIRRGLSMALDRLQAPSLASLRDSDVEKWAAETL